ncbi:YbcC family protein [Fulvivirga lutea]|uniref:Probable inorganic carbon transporter subunit DabA n=1 Tax=Fulvivirga lutea TaxID=2810512 RepID=A0A974WHX1_9BACT|nr:DUF2309 domain-containing protein [Fulvivirga lutea]QSE98209.1 DUF2309 domain-containing protein [Fulvivirga lutea]
MQLAEKQNIKEVESLLKNTSAKIAPLWSLENFVAVNPYLGMANRPFGEVMQQLKITADAEPTLPISFYLKALEEGRISKEDIANALNKHKQGINADEFLAQLFEQTDDQAFKVKTVGDLASNLKGKDWKRFMIDRISHWAAAYFDQNQATWKTAKKQDSLYTAWKEEAEVDYSTELMGLSGFKNLVKTLPENSLEAAKTILEKLKVPENALELYLQRLAMTMSGWAGFCARIDFEANLAGNKESRATSEFITILLSWEYCLLELIKSDELKSEWSVNKSIIVTYNHVEGADKQVLNQLVLQDAFDLANQRTIINKIAKDGKSAIEAKTPRAQAIFCIDVRSELYRRNLEALDPDIATMGFAGFFAFPVKYTQMGHEHGSNNCPVLLNTSHTIKETTGDAQVDAKIIANRSLKQHVQKAWSTFKSGAVSCFSFVSPIGLSFLPKLFTNSFGLTRPVIHPDQVGLDDKTVEKKRVSLEANKDVTGAYGIPLEERIKMAENTLRAMSLTENFSKSVLIVGHGSSTVNNPHATGLDCGACGGNTGEANAKVAATVLNDSDVRKALINVGIEIPETTVFIACKHDTTTDEVTLFNIDLIPASHNEEISHLKKYLRMAAIAARSERGQRMNLKEGNVEQQVFARSKDWSQVRPEWGLAGCSSFIVAPRERTQGVDFGGKAFLHSYDWKKDKTFGVLELIMTAPMVVTSWINLQYYASTVDNKVFGSGNKTLHNVVGGLGVFEGFAGDLRVGLPLQSVFDGQKYQHEPQRLNVIIEAPVDEMSKILEKHQSIRDLCDNEWIYLFAMNAEGKVAYKYIGDLQWEVV